MYFSQTAEYALRAMACIALKKEKGPIPSKILAEATGIPGHYLSKIMRKLVEAGLVDSQKGHGGGFQLAQPPEKISFKRIMEAVDYNLDSESCVFGWDKCSNEEPCPLHSTWSSLKDSFQWWSENMTLRDVIEDPGKTESLLSSGKSL